MSMIQMWLIGTVIGVCIGLGILWAVGAFEPSQDCSDLLADYTEQSTFPYNVLHDTVQDRLKLEALEQTYVQECGP